MRLKEFRSAKGVTQKEVANAIGCSPTVYSRYENQTRQPDVPTVCLLAKYYETTTDEIIGYTSESDLH